MHTNIHMGGDKITYEQTNGWGQNHIRTNQIGGDRNTYKQSNGWGQNHIRTKQIGGDRSVTDIRTDALNPCSYIISDMNMYAIDHGTPM